MISRQKPSNLKLATTVLALTSLQVSSSATPQDDERGMASAWPVAVVTNTPNNTPTGVRLKVPGDQSGPGGTPPNLLTTGTAPGGAVDVPFYQINASGSPLAGIQFDAISSGNAVIGVPQEGRPQFPEGWMNLTVTIGNETIPGTLSGPFADATSANRSPGADLVSYAFDGSVGPNQSLIGGPVLEATRMDLGFAAGSLNNLNGFDYGIGVRAYNSATATSSFFPETNRFYFSVTYGYAADYTGPGFLAHPSLPAGSPRVMPNPTDIYRSKFVNGSWSEPELFIPGDFMGFDRANWRSTHDDLDAFDLDVLAMENTQPRIVVIYSGSAGYASGHASGYGLIANRSDWSQLMIVSLNADIDGESTLIAPSTAGKPLKDKDAGGAPIRVTGGIGVGVGDFENESEVDGLCSLDPELGAAGRMVGFPVNNNLNLGSAMGLSVVSYDDSAPGLMQKSHLFQATGWGSTSPADCKAILLRRPVTYVVKAGVVSGSGRWDWVAEIDRLRSEPQVLFEVPPVSSSGQYAYKVLLSDANSGAILTQSLHSLINH